MAIAVVLISGILWWLGGRNWSNKMFRRIGVPLILALYIAIKCDWRLFILYGSALGLTIPVGYGEPSSDDPDPSWLGLIFQKGWKIRGIYGLIVALSSTWLFALGCINLGAYLAYLGLNFAVGGILCALKAPDFIIEPLIGAGIASIVFFLK